MRRIALLATVACLTIGPALADEALPLSRGQTVYVPVYSHIDHGNLDNMGKPAELLLSAMLSIRNTDPRHAMEITSVRYYDTSGKVLREFIKTPSALGPMASTSHFVEHRDKTGGSGANFVVEWKAETAINPPIIETVNAYFFGTQSVAFTSPGRPIKAK